MESRGFGGPRIRAHNDLYFAHPDHRVTFITTVRSHYQEPEEVEKVWRLACGGTDARIDSKGRISIPVVCLEHAGIEPPQQVRIPRVGLWYEVTAWGLQGRGDAA